MWDINDVDFDQEAPKDRKPCIHVLSPRSNQRMAAVSLSSRPVLTVTHHYRGRTIPHLKDASKCLGCKNKLPKRYKGYLAGLYGAQLRLIEFTHQAWVDNAFLLEDPTVDLRGKWITLSRGKSPRGAVKMTIEEMPLAYADKALPIAFDIKQALLRIWNGESRQPVSEDQDGGYTVDSVA